jgi:hypothetical protein
LTSAFIEPVKAQTNDLTSEQIEEFKELVTELLNSFQIRLSVIASKDPDYTPAIKKEFIKQTLSLFLEHGEPYFDEYNNERRSVQMQVSSLRGGKEVIKSLPMKQYLVNLTKLYYRKVEITQAETLKISDFKKVGDHYEATATLFQKFVGYNSEGKILYGDTTRKVVRIIIQTGIDRFGKEIRQVILGDVDVAETEAL